jgi:hypothetical protein
MEFLRYAPHLDTKKLKVNRFLFGLNVSLREKVRIMMPQTLHDVVQKALIVEKELVSGGQSRTPVRPAGMCHPVRSSIRHQPDIRQDIVASREDALSLHLGDQHLSSRLLTGDHSISCNVDHNSSNLGLFSRIDQDSRPVGRQLLHRVP